MNIDFYKENIQNLFVKLNTSKNGISNVEAENRIKKYGNNELLINYKASNFKVFINQFKNLSILILIFTSLFSVTVSFTRKEPFVSFIFLIIITIFNIILGFIQEKKSNDSIKELSKLFNSNNVLRDGVKTKIDSKKIVVGDIIELESGDYISADCRIIFSDGLEVDESLLTGNHEYIKKNAVEISEDKTINNRNNMLYSGTKIVNGHAFALVCSIGMNTRFGKIVNNLADKKKDITPLQKIMRDINKAISYVLFTIILIILIYSLIMKYDYFDVLMLSVTLAVAAIPISLNLVTIIILSLSKKNMADKNISVRQMESIYSLGVIDIMYYDKIETIGKNSMIINLFYLNDKLYKDNIDIEHCETLKLCAYYCNNSTNDELDLSIHKYLENINYNNNSFNKINEFAYDSNRKMMSVVVKNNINTFSFTRGNLEEILLNCDKYLNNGKIYPLTIEHKNNILNMIKSNTNDLSKLAAFSYKYNDFNNLEQNMVFVGVIGMTSSLEKNNVLTNTLINLGIKPIMITEKDIHSAISIAKERGIINSDSEAIDGEIIDKMSTSELIREISKYKVYANISLDNKLKIIEAYQRNELVVLVVADGVENALSVQKADIGIAIGKNNNEVINNTSDCVILDDNFSTILEGIKEGKKITSSIRKVIFYLLSICLVEVILIFVSMLLNIEILSPLQILWINLITITIPAIMIYFEKHSDNFKDNTLKNDSFFTPFIIFKIIMNSIIKAIVILLIYLYYLKFYDVIIARTLVFIFLIGNGLLYSISCRNLEKSIFNKNIFNNIKLYISILCIILVQLLFFNSKLSGYLIYSIYDSNAILITLSVCLIVFILGEFVKPIYSKIFKNNFIN